MALATNAPGGQLNTLNDKCTIYIPKPGGGVEALKPKILPEISDTKKATYADTTIIGRSMPIKTYSHSDNRVITMRLHFMVIEPNDIFQNAFDLWTIESATYPRKGNPYKPPPVCKIDCGVMLGIEPLCVVLESYNVSYPTNVVWDPDLLVPYYFQVNTTWHVVYTSSGGGANSLPGQERIFNEGR